MEKEVVGKKAGQDPRMKRGHFEEGLALADRLEKELKCEIKMIEGRGIDEPLIIYRGRKIAQIAPRKGHLFTCYRFWSKDKIVKVCNNDDIDSLYESFADHIKELETKPKPRKKSGGRQSHSLEVIAELKKRINKLPKDATGIELKKGILTKEIRDWAKTNGYTITGDRLLINKV